MKSIAKGMEMNGLRDSQLNLLWTARIDYAAGSHVELHRHDDYEQLLVVLSGEGRITGGDLVDEVQAGSSYLFLKGVPHSFRFTGETVTLDFKFRLLDPSVREALAGAAPVCLCKGWELSELKHWYKASLRHARNPAAFHPIRIEAGFKGTLVSMLLNRLPSDQEASSSAMHADENDPIVQYLRANFSTEITLERLSRHFGFNPNYLIKIFYDKTGLTPIQFLQEIRLEKAREMLEFSSLTISEVAEYVGWTTPYFSKIFKKRIGQSPSQYRDLLINAIGKDIILEQDFSNEWRIMRL
ncbi:HTH-type transcriptional activator RhaR [Paenibacillus solanacearum]|uniref:HTH-type transcriptional activator RhaR n=1 Tax=Paenibacillus solanacearum TaxID=2048548 RepID=A0A916K6Q7_9BACL|nr:AraC family transcriptional regulator [Paenibacillus solanacearum]CAG7645151.1 HTH-type transcriptional activator RhaR [Paenibacillus solanacearum]